MARLGRRKDSLSPREALSCLKDIGLLDRDCPHIALIVEFRENRAHTVEAKTARMVGRRNELVADRVHLGKRSHMARIAEVVYIFTPGK